jgi:hypothetical protein
MWTVWLHHSAEILATDGGVVGCCDVPAPLLACLTGAWASWNAPVRERIASHLFAFSSRTLLSFPSIP